MLRKSRGMVGQAVLVGLLLSAAAFADEKRFELPRLPEQPQALSGEVRVESVGEDRILVAVDTSNEGRPLDGIVDVVYWFRSEEPLFLPVSLHFDFANLEARAGRLRLSTPNDGKAVLLLSLLPRTGERIGNQPEVVQEAARAEADQAIVLKRGIALTEHRGGFKITLDQIALGEAGIRSSPLAVVGDIDNQDYSPPGSGGGCSSGGFGSTSCSNSCSGGSCSTQCSGNTYACCNCGPSGATCSCKLTV
jgi:hypothetical protein